MQDTTGQTLPTTNNNIKNNSQHPKLQQKDQSHHQPQPLQIQKEQQHQSQPLPPGPQQQQQQQNHHPQQQQQQQTPPPRSVSIFVYKTLNTVFKSSRKIIFRVCEVASAKKSLKMFNLYSSMKNRNEGSEREPTTGHDRFCQTRVTNRSKKRKNSKNVRRTNSANEIDQTILTAAARRQLFSSHRSASSDLENSDHSEHSEKSPLVSVRLESLAKIFFNKPTNNTTTSSTTTTTTTTGSTNGTNRNSIDSTTTRPNLKYQYTALDSGNGIQERGPRERAARDRALSACQEWIQNTNGRYDIIAHLDEIGSRHNKNWFLINDTTVRTDRLMTLLPLPPDCIALEELPPSETPKGLFMELLGSLHHPYIYPVLDLGFLHTDSINYACLVMPFNPRGSLKDLIYKAQWNEPWSRKYTRKPTCLPISQVQRLGRQILEALLFLRERGFPLHGHLHSGNVILQNGVARLSGLENGLLGLSSRVNAVMWSRSISDIDNIDIICFGHLLYEMCVGSELNTPQPSTTFLEMELDRYPQILEILQLIFEPNNGCNVTVEDLVLCDLFRNIDLRELRGPCVSTIKPSLSKSTLNLLHAVKKRQSASLGESFSEASSPCTPPSTPRDRRTGMADSFDISSDSDGGLDEVVITSSSYDSHQYDPLNSPIHFCDNSLQSDDNNSAGGGSISSTMPVSASSSNTSPRLGETIVGDFETSISPCTSQSSSALNNQLTTDICNYKNSKSRRLEYSLRCMKYGRSNPSQDSAFGSLTDGELSIASSSFRLSSFQSIGSPIDEGVEDMIVATTIANETSLELTTTLVSPNHRTQVSPTQAQIQIDSVVSEAACRESSPNRTSPSGTDEMNTRSHLHTHHHHHQNHHHSHPQNNFSLSPSPRKCTTDSPSLQNLQFDPPKILVNDQNSIYTTSPSKRSQTIEVFSQKYRVSSFEDMTASTSPQGRKHLRSVNKITFRSLEDERRIDNAFQPIRTRTNSENRVYNINNTEKYKKLTHTSFSHRISNSGFNSRESNLHMPQTPTPPPPPSSPRDRHTMWRDSIFYRKNKIAKSNDSLLESTASSPKLSPSKQRSGDSYELRKALNRGNSVNEIASCTKRDPDDLLIGSTDHLRIDPRKSRSERHLYSLGKLKQTTISDCFSEDETYTTTHFHDNKPGRLSLPPSNTINRPNSTNVNYSSVSIFQSCEESPMEEINATSSQEITPLHHQQSHQNICKIIGGVDDPPSSSEEKTPLLESMELSQISPTDSESEPPL